MLKTYDKLEDVPEALREHYTMRSGRAVPEVSTDHPLVVNNAKLLSDVSTAETKAATAESKAAGLQADLDSAKASSLPRGHVAVLKADADLLEKVKPLGTAEEIQAKLTEHATLKRDTALRAVADAGYSFAALKDFDALESGLEYTVKDEQKDGKTTKNVYVTVEGKERPLDEYAKEKRPALASILKTEEKQEGKAYVNQSAGGKAPAGDLYAQIREDAKKRDEEKKKDAIPLESRKNLTVIGAST